MDPQLLFYAGFIEIKAVLLVFIIYKIYEKCFCSWKFLPQKELVTDKVTSIGSSLRRHQTLSCKDLQTKEQFKVAGLSQSFEQK